MRLARSITAAALVAGFGAAVIGADQSELTFSDIRFLGGVDEGMSASYGDDMSPRLSPETSVALMFGDIGDKDTQDLGWDADLGVVLGLQLDVANWRAYDRNAGGYAYLNTYGGSILFGLGDQVNKGLEVELYGLYGGGFVSDGILAHADLHRVGHYRRWGIEAAANWTVEGHYLVGFLFGWDTLSGDNQSSGGSLDSSFKSGGFNLSGMVGYRF